MENDGCWLEALDISRDGGPIETEWTRAAPGSTVCSNGVCETPLGTRMVSWLQDDDWAIGEPKAAWDGELIGTMIEDNGTRRWRFVLAAMTQHRTSSFRYEQEFDDDGRPLSFIENRLDRNYLEATLTWEGEQLVKASTIASGFGSEARHFEWSYDDKGRLTGSTMDNWGVGPDLRPLETSYTYGDHGHLAQVERRYNGQSWIQQTWTVDDASALQESQLLGEALEVPYHQRLFVDDHLHTIPFVAWERTARVSTSVEEGAEGCHKLPTAGTIGYPETDGIYELGWPADDRPNRIGFDYGCDTFAFSYCRDAWFGHAGLASHYLADVHASAFDIRIRYTEGIATEEIGEYAGQHLSDAWTRTRTLDGTRITEDTRISQRSFDPEAVLSTMTFAYDDEGRITARRTRHNGEDRGHQSWTHHPNGVASHEITATNHLGDVQTTRLEASHDIDDVDRVRFRLHDGGQEIIDIVDTTDLPEGRLEQRGGAWDALSSQLFDAKGRLVVTGYGPWDNLIHSTRRTWNQDGWLSGIEAKRPNDPLVHETYRYHCD
jgi:hypothetical protein